MTGLICRGLVAGRPSCRRCGETGASKLSGTCSHTNVARGSRALRGRGLVQAGGSVLPGGIGRGKLGRVETLVLATRNRHKVEEIRAILGDGLTYRVLSDWPDAPELRETARTFAGNAALKATQVWHWLKQRVMRGERGGVGPCWWVLADDSGLEVDALDGAPGVDSARFAALETGAPGNSPDSENNAKLLHLLRGVPPERRRGRFRCVLALVGGTSPEVEPAVRFFEGVCEGRILEAPAGTGGFGYDPLFVPDGYEESFAQLGPEVKNRISHRARALAAMARWWQERRAEFNPRS